MDSGQQRKNSEFLQCCNLFGMGSKLAGRDIDEDEYITADWIKEQYEKSSKCCNCCETMEIANDNSYNDNNLTVNRIHNEYAHTKNNSQLMCHHCNISMH
jgi:hypothetical protein